MLRLSKICRAAMFLCITSHAVAAQLPHCDSGIPLKEMDVAALINAANQANQSNDRDAEVCFLGQAADKGSGAAQKTLGKMWLDRAEALQWADQTDNYQAARFLTMAANQQGASQGEARYLLSRLYDVGAGVMPNHEYAQQLLRDSAALGYAPAATALTPVPPRVLDTNVLLPPPPVRVVPRSDPNSAGTQRAQPASAVDLSGLWVGNVRMIFGVVRSLDVVIRQDGNGIRGEWRKEEVEINPGKYAVVEFQGTVAARGISLRETAIKEDHLGDLRWCNQSVAAFSLAADGTLTGKATCGSENNPILLRRIGPGTSLADAQKTREKWVQVCSTSPVIDVMPRLASDYWRDPMVSFASGMIGGALNIRLDDNEEIAENSLRFGSLSGTNPGMEMGSFVCEATLFESMTIVDRKTRKVTRQVKSLPEDMTYILTPSPEGFSVRVNATASRVYSAEVRTH